MIKFVPLRAFMIRTFTKFVSSLSFSIFIKYNTTMEIRSCREHVFNKCCLFIKTSSLLHLFLVWINQLGSYIHRRRVIYFVPYLIDSERGWLKIPGSLLCFKQGPVVLEIHIYGSYLIYMNRETIVSFFCILFTYSVSFIWLLPCIFNLCCWHSVCFMSYQRRRPFPKCYMLIQCVYCCTITHFLFSCTLFDSVIKFVSTMRLLHSSVL